MAVSAIRGITLDELVALNDEIIALVRAGVPLDRGLVSLGTDLPGRLGTLADTLGRRLESGESLAEMLEDSGDGLPARLPGRGGGRNSIGQPAVGARRYFDGRSPRIGTFDES